MSGGREELCAKLVETDKAIETLQREIEVMKINLASIEKRRSDLIRKLQ